MLDKKTGFLIISIILLLGIFSAGRIALADEPEPKPEQPVFDPHPEVIHLLDVDEKPVGQGPVNYGLGINPLTGLEVTDPELLDRRPLAIKITNYPRSVRPQSGLTSADIVYEYYMERSITRYIAIFYGNNAERVGPVRSGRFFDEHIFRMYDAFFVFGSADRRVLDYFMELGNYVINSLIIESPDDKKTYCNTKYDYPLCRDQTIKSYNNMFANTAEISQKVEDENRINTAPDLSGMHFSEISPLGGELGSQIVVKFSLVMYSRWTYSVDEGRYLREVETVGKPNPAPEFEEFAQHIDYNNGEQIGADNLVMLFVEHEYYTKTATTEILKINLVGSGDAIVFRDGFAYPATWIRPADGGVLQLYKTDGEVFPLKPGTTWFSVLNTTSETLHEDGDWRFIFYPPPEPLEPIIPPEEEDTEVFLPVQRS